MYVIPAKGRQVPDPFLGDNLPPQGREVEANQYWLRRILDEDVTEGTPPVEQTEASQGNKSKSKGATNESTT